MEDKETMFNSIRIKMQQFCTNAFSDFNSPFEFFFDFENEEPIKWSSFIKNEQYGKNPPNKRPQLGETFSEHSRQHFHQNRRRDHLVNEQESLFEGTEVVWQEGAVEAPAQIHKQKRSADGARTQPLERSLRRDLLLFDEP